MHWFKGNVAGNPLDFMGKKPSIALPGTSAESILPPLFGRAHAAAKALEARRRWLGRRMGRQYCWHFM